MPGSGNPRTGEFVGLIAVGLIVFAGLVAYSAVASVFGWPQLQ